MRIPRTTVKPRYYVAALETEAFSSWNLMTEALDCLNRFRDRAQLDDRIAADFKNIIGIVRTDNDGRRLVFEKKWM